MLCSPLYALTFSFWIMLTEGNDRIIKYFSVSSPTYFMFPGHSIGSRQTYINRNTVASSQVAEVTYGRTEAVYWNSIIKKIKASSPTKGSANMLRVLPTIKRINWPHSGVTSWPLLIVHNELLHQHISNLGSRFHCRPQHTATKTFQAIGEH